MRSHRAQNLARRGRQQRNGSGGSCRAVRGKPTGRFGHFDEFWRAEFPNEQGLDQVFTTPSGHSGVTFVASTGDNGNPGEYPAYSPNVLAVGGTSLTLNSQNQITSETGWSGSGGGTSTMEPQPSYQSGVVTQSTTQRTIPDVAFDANPNTGVTIYDSYNGGTSTPWEEIGGTSVAAPSWAALIAIANQGRNVAGLPNLDGAQWNAAGALRLAQH